MLELNKCWFASRIVQVRGKYGLAIDQGEADALGGVLSACKYARKDAPYMILYEEHTVWPSCRGLKDSHGDVSPEGERR